jgi:hypothetical protein
MLYNALVSSSPHLVGAELEHDVDVVRVLEVGVEANDEGVLQTAVDLDLGEELWGEERKGMEEERAQDGMMGVSGPGRVVWVGGERYENSSMGQGSVKGCLLAAVKRSATSPRLR